MCSGTTSFVWRVSSAGRLWLRTQASRNGRPTGLHAGPATLNARPSLSPSPVCSSAMPPPTRPSAAPSAPTRPHCVSPPSSQAAPAGPRCCCRESNKASSSLGTRALGPGGRTVGGKDTPGAGDLVGEGELEAGDKKLPEGEGGTEGVRRVSGRVLLTGRTAAHPPTCSRRNGSGGRT
jgi:hypothetical protein